MPPTSSPPPEPPGGQDDPPETLTAVRAVLRLLADIREFLADTPGPEAIEMRGRIAAHRAALARLRDRIIDDRR